MKKNTKTFFSKKRAEQFKETLTKEGVTEVEIWNGTDAFNQITFTVKWNVEE